jgi:hypothetical protein
VSWAVTSQSYFFSDDFLIAKFIEDNSLNAEALTRSWFGHFMPGYILADGIFLQLFSLSWVAAGVVIAAIHTLTFVAFVRVLDATVGRVYLVIGFGLVFSFAVGVFVTRLWWAASLNNMLALALCLAALALLTRFIREGHRRHLVTGLFAFAAALSVSEKTLLFSAYILFWMLLVVLRGAKVRERLVILQRAWPAWLGLAVLCVIDIAIFTSGPYLESSGTAPSLYDSVVFIAWGVAGGVIPSFFGMDLQTMQPWWQLVGIVLSCLALASAVVLSIRRIPSLGGVWLFVAAAVISSVGVLSRRADLIGLDGSRILRYHLEATALFWLAAAVIAFVLLTETTLRNTRQSRLEQRVLAITVLTGVAGSLVLWTPAVQANVQGHPGVQTRNWVEELARNEPDTGFPPFLNTTVPEFVVISGLAPYDQASAVLPFIKPGLATTDQLDGAWTVNDAGNAGPAVFIPASDASPVGTCDLGSGIQAHDVAGQAGQFLVVDFRDAEPGEIYLDVGYLTSRSIETSAGQLVVELVKDLPARRLHFSSNGNDLCVDSVQVGDIAPAPAQ